MKPKPRQSLAVALVGLLSFLTGIPVRAQCTSSSPCHLAGNLLLHDDDVAGDADIRLASATEPTSAGCLDCSDCGCPQCCPVACTGGADPGFFVGAEYLLVRPHFSEAIAFARGSLAPTLQIVGRELQFDYDDSVRALVGYRFGGGSGELRFTYWGLDSDIAPSGTAGVGQFIVDPFGNNVGALPVIDPGDARFTPPPGLTFLPGGDFIQTRATVKTHVYDLDIVKPIPLRNPYWRLDWSVGARLADIDQFYESVITNGGLFFSRGDFAVDFIGAGPRLGFEARRYFGQLGRLSLFINGHGALLVGEYDVRSSNTVTIPFPFSASQQTSLTRTIPVVETELGASWQIGSSLNLSAGWLLQAWFDMGTSGGHFGGYFGGADDSNTMSYDGLFVRAEWAF